MNLFTLEGDNTRPTLNRVKETIFNILSFDLRDTSFLDLFAGSGGIGIEAISRGAKESYFLDNSKDAINIINKNVSKAKFEDRAIIETIDSLSFLNKTKKTFDIIYIDPPYNKNLHNDALKIISERNLLNEDGIIVVEVASNDKIEEEHVNNYTMYKEKNFKSFDIYFYRNE